MMDPSDEKAILLLRAGNISGLEFLVKKYYPGALRVSTFITNDPYVAEEIVQSAFITVHEKIWQFDTNRGFRAWFNRIVINESIKSANGKKRFLPLDEIAITENEGLFNAHSRFPEDEAISEQVRRAVWEAICQLPPKERAVVVLKYDQGLSEKEISETLNRPLGTIKSQLHNARKRLDGLLSPFFEEGKTASTQVSKQASVREKGK